MKKLLLLILLPFALFGCSKDRNYDGAVTISDYVLGFQGFFIPFGKFSKNLVNAFIDSGVGKFLEFNNFYPDRDELFVLGMFSFMFMLFSVGGLINLWEFYAEQRRGRRKAVRIAIREAREQAEFKKELKAKKKSE